MMKRLKIEKAKMEKMLKKRDEMLRQKDVELKIKEREQEKLWHELKMSQKWKEKKIYWLKKKRPCSSCKGQWTEINKNPEAVIKEASNISGAKWKSKEKKPKEKKVQALYSKVFQMELNQLKHGVKITNERLDHMSCNLRTPNPKS